VPAALDDLVALLDLERIEVNHFRGHNPDEKRVRIFGGQVAGQALVAAGRTVPSDRFVHSLHAYFLRPGDPRTPVLYVVDRIRDGRSFTTRRTVAVQHGEAIFHLSASFQVPEEGPEHQDPMPEAPTPASLPPFAERFAPYKELLGDWYTRPRPIDTRYAQAPTVSKERRPPRQQVWFRADGELPEDPLLHACVLAYASDMTLLDSVLLPHGITWFDAEFMGASLDHAMWFHRPFRTDRWLLYDQASPSATGARGLAQGQIYDADGRLVVTVVQEGLVRRIRPH
jgi:acyl-CoA thioesterase-2